MGAHVDKQHVVFETGLFNIGKLYFSWSSKATLFPSLCVYSAFNQGFDLQTICVKSSSQRNRCWDRIRSVMALLGEESILPMGAEGQEAGLDKWGVYMTPRKEKGKRRIEQGELRL